MLRSIIFLSIILLSLISVKLEAGIGNESCEKIKDDCEYYSCFETKRKCGRFGYSIGFGKKYCLRFEKKKTSFSKEGQIWIDQTRNCLIKKLQENIDLKSCRKIKQNSFKEHLSCYVESGFCQLSKADKKEIYKTVWPSFWRLRTIKAGFSIKKICKGLKF